MNVCRKAKRVISIKGSFDSIAICEVMLEEEGVDEHLLMNPKLA